MDRRGVVVAAVVVVAVALGGGYLLVVGTGNSSQYTLTADPLTPEAVADDAVADLDGRAARVAERAVVNGSTTALGQPPRLDGDYVLHAGDYYLVKVVSEEIEIAERPAVTLVETNRSGDARDVATLPVVDQRVVRTAARSRVSPGPLTLTHNYHWSGAANASVLATGDVERVRAWNRTFRVEVSQGDPRLNRYRYTATRVAGNASALADRVARDADGLSNDTVLERAVAYGQFVSRGRSSRSAYGPVEPVVELCGVSPDWFVDRPGTATCYVRYRGSYYRLTIDGTRGS